MISYGTHLLLVLCVNKGPFSFPLDEPIIDFVLGLWVLYVKNCGVHKANF